jgi:hypothetical protein
VGAVGGQQFSLTDDGICPLAWFEELIEKGMGD